jgi:predicted O-methyltransferase YrrM
MLNRLMPRSMRASSERRKDAQALAALPPASLDARALRSALPDFEAVGAEWPAVEAVMSSVGLIDPQGGVNRGDRRLIYQLARALPAKSVLEVGTHVGASTLMLALAMQKNGGKLTTVDIADVNRPDAYWKTYGCRQNPKDTLAMAGVSATFHQKDSVEWLQQDRATYDLIFLDGLHEGQQLYRELPLALRRLNPAGMILLHDVFPDHKPLWPDGNVISGPWHAVERYSQEKAPIKVLPLGSLPWPTKQGTSITSLAVVLAP